MKLDKLLVTTDLSEASEPALQSASDLAKRLGMEVTLVTVLDFDTFVPPGAIALSKERDEQLRAEIRTKVDGALDGLVEKHFAGMPVTKRLLEGGGAALTICDLAAREGHDLIVISTHGRTGLRRLLIGSVAENVVRHSPCAVLTVHPGKSA